MVGPILFLKWLVIISNVLLPAFYLMFSVVMFFIDVRVFVK